MNAALRVKESMVFNIIAIAVSPSWRKSETTRPKKLIARRLIACLEETVAKRHRNTTSRFPAVADEVDIIPVQDYRDTQIQKLFNEIVRMQRWNYQQR